MAKKAGFRFTRQSVKFTHKNERLENHGPNEKINAVDLSFSLDVENEMLDAIAPGLRDSFYRVPSKDELGDLVDHAKATEPIRLKYPQIAEQSWTQDMPNFDLTFHYGIDETTDMVLEECTVKSIKFEMHDGGTVTLAWKVGARPSDEQIARLSERLRTGTVEISLAHRKPAAAKKGDLLDNAPEANAVEKAARKRPAHEADPEHHANPADSLH